MMGGMVIDMHDAQLQTLDQVRAFLKGTVALGFSVAAAERYEFVARIVRRFGYAPGSSGPTKARCCAFWGA